MFFLDSVQNDDDDDDGDDSAWAHVEFWGLFASDAGTMGDHGVDQKEAGDVPSISTWDCNSICSWMYIAGLISPYYTIWNSQVALMLYPQWCTAYIPVSTHWVQRCWFFVEQTVHPIPVHSHWHPFTI